MRAAWLGLAFVVSVLPLLAGGPAEAKPRYCLTEAEIKSEQEIRHGIFLREATLRCEAWVPGMRAGWDSFAAANGQRFDAANKRRVKAFQREFEQDWQNELNRSDGRIVTYHRHNPLSKGYCDGVDKLVKELARGYRAFTEQAATIQNEIIRDFKVCRK